MLTSRMPDLKTFRLLVLIALSLCIAAFVVCSLHWPIIGDAALMHYVIFLIDRGAAPYRDIADLNMPGSYLVEWAVIHLFGSGDLAWRIFDLVLMASSIVAMIVITLPLDWFAGLWAGSLFLLVHGRDGIVQLGQRDLTLATCLLAAYALLFLALRKKLPPLAIAFGLFSAMAATIKPTMLPLGPVLLLLACIQLRRQSQPSLRLLVYGLTGWLLPLATAAIYLWRKHALSAFLTTTRNMVLYHASLVRRPLDYLLLHSISPLMPLVAAWLVLLFLHRKQLTWERLALWIGLGFGLFSYLVQAKGYAYQRYPFLAFLLLLLAIDFSSALKNRGITRALGVAGLALGAFFLAPTSTVMASRYTWRDLAMIGTIQQDLKALGPNKLSGGIQCIDSIAGCTNALYRMKLDERSYIFYDEFLFGPSSIPAIQQSRDKFWRDIRQAPPEVIIVSAPLFPSGPDNYTKLSLWPQFNAYLNEQYQLYLQRTPTQTVRWWSRPETPASYRIYLRKPSPPSQP